MQKYIKFIKIKKGVSWNQYTGGYHAYYTDSSNSFEVNSLLPTGQEGREFAYPTNINSVTMVINKDGFHVDGKLVTSNSRIGELSTIQIGSAEGNIRSNATYEYIKIVKYN